MRKRSLQDQVALVTGASHGIGEAIARALAEQDVRVVLTGRDPGALDAACAALDAKRPGAALAVQADMRSAVAVERAVDAAVTHFGGLDILVNNAGVGLFAPVSEMTGEQWTTVIDTNLTGVFHACRAAIPHLRRRGGGYIINISSLAGSNPFVGGAAYCASKAGLNALSEVLMQEVRFDDIRVSCVAPGSVLTEFAGNDRIHGGDWKLRPEDVAEVVIGLLHHDPRCLPSRVEMRPSKPRKS
jgi:NAD(P)-dependent dehydrogenase (short-subunit alcohol dehydrogenase family)